MKTVLYFALLCIPNFCLSAPSWLPINPAFKYHFTLSDSISLHLNSNPLHATTIRVLASEQTDDKQICRLNTILDRSILRYRQPQFLQHEMIIRENGDVLFHEPESILLKTNTNVGQSWMFDTLAGVTATQIEAIQESLYGQIDSVKIFLLSTGDTIRLAKKHGLMQYPYQYGSNIYYQQIGVSGLDQGFFPPDFFNCYHFEPGDRFEYRQQISQPYGSVNVISQFSVIARDHSLESGVRYEVKGFSKSTFNDHGNLRTTYNTFDSFEQEEMEFNHLNYYNREGFVTPALSTVTAVSTGQFMDFPDLITKKLEIHNAQPMLCQNPEDLDALCCDYCDYVPSTWTQLLHGKGLGLIRKSSYDDNYQIEEELVAVQKKDFSFGEFTQISELTENGQVPSNTQASPNPAQNEVQITLIPYDPNSVLVLSDSSGRVLKERPFTTPTLHIDLTNYAPGIYFYLIKDGAGKAGGFGKFVKAAF